jgi:hypothetical protein
MKTVLTLIMAVVVFFSSFGQAGPPSGGAVAGSPVMIDSLSRTDPLALTDSLRRVDSLLHARIKVLAFPAAIDAVMRDFPNNLRNITGELLLAQGETDNYASIVELEGAENCRITRYHSTEDTTASWQANMFSSDDFGKAARQYHELFGKLKQCSVQLEDSTIVFFEGAWEPAKEDIPFTTSTLRLRSGDWRYKEVKVELELVYLMADWAVHINIVSKKRDDEVGGKVVLIDQ